jgi:hypothetical protein
MRSVRPASPFHRVHVTKRVLGTTRKSVVDLVHCSFTILPERTPSAPLSFLRPADGPREAVIGTARPLLASSERALIFSEATRYLHALWSEVLTQGV